MTIKLDRNADIVSLPELAQDLLRRIRIFKAELDIFGEGYHLYAHLNGVIAGYETILSAIGYIDPEEEGN